MKSIKISVLALLFFVNYQAFSQVFTIQGGTNLSKMFFKDDDGKQNDGIESNFGFNAGVTAEFALAKSFYFETGLLFSQRGAKEKVDLGIFTTSGKVNLSYINVPFNIIYKKSLSDKVSIYGSTGAYFGYGINGKVKVKVDNVIGDIDIDIDEEEDIKWGNDKNDDHFKRVDFGLNLGAGLEINNIKLGATYGLGLYNIASDTDFGNTIRNKALQFSIGYRIGKH